MTSKTRSSKNSNKSESAINVILKHEALHHLITKTIKSELSSELTPLQNQIYYLKIKLDDQEQY
jgi:negative regulator of genetic competence, sporulation and motility